MLSTSRVLLQTGTNAQSMAFRLSPTPLAAAKERSSEEMDIVAMYYCYKLLPFLASVIL